MCSATTGGSAVITWLVICGGSLAHRTDLVAAQGPAAPLLPWEGPGPISQSTLPSGETPTLGTRTRRPEELTRRGRTMSSNSTLSPEEAADRLALRELFDAYARCADTRDAA